MNGWIVVDSIARSDEKFKNVVLPLNLKSFWKRVYIILLVYVKTFF